MMLRAGDRLINSDHIILVERFKEKVLITTSETGSLDKIPLDGTEQDEFLAELASFVAPQRITRDDHEI